MAAQLPEPGVEVIQQFQTVSPSVISPTLVPCIVGACKQVVAAVVPSATGSSTVNSQAQVSTPAAFVATAASPTYSLNGHLDFSVNGNPVVVVTFASGTYAPSDVVLAVNTALNTAGETDAYAELVGTTTWRLRTTATGDFQSIVIESSSTSGVLTAFGLASTLSYFGAGEYNGWQVRIPTTSFPDPNNNLAQLVFEVPTIRAFLSASGGASLMEELRTQTVLRKGGAVTVVSSGNGTNQSPLLSMSGQDFTSTSPAASAATVTGSAVPTFASLNGKTLIMSDGRAPVTIVFSSPGSAAAVAAQIQAAFPAVDGLTSTVSGSDLVFTSTRVREDGTTPAVGEDSQIVIYGGTAITPTNYLDSGVTPTITMGRYTGSPQAVAVGDEVWVDGVFVGKVTQVAPNGITSMLKINAQLPLTFTGSHFYIVAKNLGPLPGETANRPAPDLIVDSVGNVSLKAGLLRDTTGKIVEAVTTTALIPARANMYVSYRALRLDVTASAKNPGLLTMTDTATLTNLLSPITTDNPLGLGLFFALLNAPAISVTGLGVNAVSAAEPLGTVAAFAAAANYLEAFEVYAIAPLTHEEAVAQVFNAHVNAMSAPDQKGERICLFNPSQPTTKVPTLVTSGTNGNTVGSGGLTFDTGVGNLPQLLLAAGIDPTSAIPVSAGLYLNISDNALNYNISNVAGSVLTINVTFTGSQNADGFYTTTDLDDPPLPTALINDPFSVNIRGAKLVLTDGVTPDKDNIAATYAALGKSFSNRRFWQIVPDTCSATVNGTVQALDGFYMCAAIAGMIGQNPPQQSFTNYPMTGFSSVSGSNNFFSKSQMNVMAGGGCYIIVQDAPGAPLYSRMALTTDLTSVETRTDSITKIVDFVAKFYRRALKNFIGRFNITQGFLDSLGHVLQGLGSYLTENSVLIDAHVNNIIQDTSEPDSVLIDVTLDVPFPCNYIRMTLVV